MTACSLPDIRFDKQKRSAYSSSLASSYTVGGTSNPDKRYLTTVHIRFSESKDATPLSFDIRRDKRSLIAAKLFESEQTVTTMHLGYTRGDGPIWGFKFNWRF